MTRSEKPEPRTPAPGRAADFVVEEVLRESPGSTGDYAIYQATKRWLTTPQLQQRLAQQLGAAPRALSFPALKDRAALTTQHFSLRGAGIGQISGPNFRARLVGRLPRPLAPRDLLGNRFTVTLRSLNPQAAAAMGARLAELGREGLPNYFDQQRFGSYSPGGAFIGKAILQGNAEAALRAYLAQPVPGDTPALRAFKAFANDHWRDWDALFQEAPRSNQRSLLTFLRDHPEDFRKALNLITPRLLPLLLAAYQSFLWNRMVSRLLQRRLAGSPAQTWPVEAVNPRVEVAGEPLALYRGIPQDLAEELRGLAVPLPHHRAVFPSAEVEDAARRVLAEEGLTLDDLKARLLKRAYLPRSLCPVAVFPGETASETLTATPDNGVNIRLRFFLPPGSYGTLVLKALTAGTGDTQAWCQGLEQDTPGEGPED
ncbi:MAG TPA: tRNA pseudouridine(13) synthase TruD [Dehalococcoidia bacterium]|nr:tRNA pseudouridine(13) synthase TruD [Dehalococcoidia bacterium]